MKYFGLNTKWLCASEGRLLTQGSENQVSPLETKKFYATKLRSTWRARGKMSVIFLGCVIFLEFWMLIGSQVSSYFHWPSIRMHCVHSHKHFLVGYIRRKTRKRAKCTRLRDSLRKGNFGLYFASRVLRTWSRTLLARLPLAKDETRSLRRYMTLALCQRTNYRILREKQTSKALSRRSAQRTSEVIILLYEEGCSRNWESFTCTWMQSLISCLAIC